MSVTSSSEEKTPLTCRPVESIRAKVVPVRRTGWQDKSILNLGYAEEEEYLRSVIKQVVVGNGEGVKISTSIMVYGSPGCGKSQLVDKAVKSTEKEFGQDSFYVARLEGAYCFSLKDSIHELCHQIVDDDVEILEEMEFNDTSFDDKLESVLFYMKNKLIELKKSLIIVIDGMEKFTDDSSQRLLYNLFDISANAVFSVPIGIIGITSCVDILDSFEKRVRSRFSHRQINLVSKEEFDEYKSWAKSLLTHSKSEDWNFQVGKVLEDKEVIRTLRLVYDADKSIGQLRRFLYFATLLCEDTFTTNNIKDAYTQLFGNQSHVLMAVDLPQSELTVLLGIYKKTQRTQQAWQPSEVYEIIRKDYSLHQHRKDDFIKTIIKLQGMELIVPVGGTQTKNFSTIFESYYKCEISFIEFQQIWKVYPNLPSFYTNYL